MSTSTPLQFGGAGLAPGDHLRLDGISRSFPDRRVLTNVSLVVAFGEIACLIGENGSGKSTVLRIAAGLDAPDAGSLSVPGAVGLYHQEPPFPAAWTVAEVLADAVAPVRALALAVEHESRLLAEGDESAADRLGVAIEAARRHHAWELEHRVDRVVSGLGIDRSPRERRVCDLSGGQAARLSLGWLLLRAPETLLLDEPTNHLDDAGTDLLAELLRDWSGPVVVASHDRAFIDEVATTLIDLDPVPVAHAAVREDRGQGDSPGSGFGVTRFGGGFTAYLTHRGEERERWVRRYRDEQAELSRLRARVRSDQSVGHPGRPPRSEARASKKFYSDRNATVVARRVNDAATALARLERDQVRRPPARLRFRGFGGSGGSSRSASSGPVLTATGVAVTGRLDATDVSLGARDRLLVTGPNGSGKSTLLQVLAGRLEPDAGAMTVHGRVRRGLLGQETTWREGAMSARDVYSAAVGAETAEHVPLASLGLIAGRDVDRPVGSLSVGQRRRLDLAVLLADPPEVLLLDEPTNHLSVLLATELETALADYPGAVVVASHDRWLRSSWAGRTLELDG
ncbi:ATP-binding cassette domain-containing protein [Nostocoides sp. F2B08]|uniref:ABC-F family ATP-binding cassette domain-containing protein n=1 Tax=Nostocoides sp. F2B08 TaxID=2653936 RepID=UPI001262CF5A|nr:ABC-F family ATP-binding cassette domain-containing protein [Tetrasphaera sp. F2B08]KAB7743532.1 ATP-binding cassette domain-containing protein [Tetrasphaera sp. F2B08]